MVIRKAKKKAEKREKIEGKKQKVKNKQKSTERNLCFLARCVPSRDFFAPPVIFWAIRIEGILGSHMHSSTASTRTRVGFGPSSANPNPPGMSSAQSTGQPHAADPTMSPEHLMERLSVPEARKLLHGAIAASSAKETELQFMVSSDNLLKFFSCFTHPDGTLTLECIWFQIYRWVRATTSSSNPPTPLCPCIQQLPNCGFGCKDCLRMLNS